MVIYIFFSDTKLKSISNDLKIEINVN